MKGDSINWINNVLDEIDLVRTNEGVSFKEILEGEVYTKSFNYPETFTYYATRIGLPFTQSCIINVIDDNGIVHSLQYDDILNLNLKINYEPTTISYGFLKDYYTISYDGSKQDIFTIENTGDKIAKNIYLSGGWFSSFTSNNFDLAIGESKNVGYTITPEVFSTNETNKTYEKELLITGNFNTINKNFSITIPYKEITVLYSDGQVDESVLRNFVKFICRENPSWCPRSTANITQGGNTSVSFSAETIKKLLERQAQKEDEQEAFQKKQLELNIEQNGKMSQLLNDKNETATRLDSMDINIENTSIVLYFLVVFILFIIAGYFMFNLLTSNKFKGAIRKRFNFHKGEKSY